MDTKTKNQHSAIPEQFWSKTAEGLLVRVHTGTFAETEMLFRSRALSQTTAPRDWSRNSATRSCDTISIVTIHEFYHLSQEFGKTKMPHKY